MKALICGVCVDIRALEPEGKWTICRCGNMQARWVDPNKGTVRVVAQDRSRAFILGMNNHFLLTAVRGLSQEYMVAAGGQGEAWRKLHEEATEAPGYIFDKAKRACWACIVKVGETGDISWEPEPEGAEKEPA